MFSLFDDFTRKIGRPSRTDPWRISELQRMMLSIIHDHAEDAHGVGIAKHLRRITKNDELEDSQVYVALRRLEARGFIALKGDEARVTVPSTVRTKKVGRPRKLYFLTASGKRALTGVAIDDDLRTTGAYGDPQQGLTNAFSSRGPARTVG